MPCDQQWTQTIQFGEATDLVALIEALESLGVQSIRQEGKTLVFRGGVYRDGEFILNGYETASFPDIATIKRSYTKATVLTQADRFGWAAKIANKALVAAGFSRQW